jgi:hypothetical protein
VDRQAFDVIVIPGNDAGLNRGNEMTDILNNEAVQTALIALIVVALNALAQWVRSKVSYTKIVDDYWCYVQPVAEAVRAEVLKSLGDATLSTSVVGQIVQRGLVQFIETYRANIWEGATTNMVVNGVTNAVQNGIILEKQ